MLKQKNILVIGASGFIGGFLIEESIQRGYHVIAGIRQQTSRGHLKSKPINIIEFTHGDETKIIKQLQELKSNFGTPIYIVYNAGITKTHNTDNFHKINFLYLKTFIDALVKTEYIPEKLLYISSLSAMGDIHSFDNIPLSITDTPSPNTMYGKSKLLGEDYIRSTKIPHIILRPTGVYGPGEKDYFLMIKSIKNGINLRVGLKQQTLSFIYIKDLADAIFLGLESDVENKTYLVSDGKSYSDDEFAQLLKNILAQSHTLNIRIPFFLLKTISHTSEIVSKLSKKARTINKDKYKILKQRNWQCDISPIISELGFSPQYDLEKGLRESIEWYKKNNWL